MPVDSLHQRRQPAVETQEWIAEPVGRRVGQIGQLELVARQGVAQIGKAEEAILGDPVEQFLDHLALGHLLGGTGGIEADVVEGVAQHRPKALAQPFLALLQPTLDQPGQGRARYGVNDD